MRKHFAGLLILFGMVIGLAVPVLAAGYQPLKIEPSRFIFEGKPGEQLTGSITVINQGAEAATPKALLSDWTLDYSNKLVVQEGGSLASSLSGWIKFNPRQFTLQPKEGQTVRFTIRIPRDAAAGERRGMIAFEQTVPYEGQGAGATARVQVTSTIYVAVLPVKRTCELIKGEIGFDRKAGLTTVAVDLKGIGNAHFRGNAVFQIVKEGAKDPVAKGGFEPLVVMPNVTTRFFGAWKGKLEPGKYQVVVAVKSEEPSVPVITATFAHVQQ